MKSTRAVKRILAGYEADPPGVKASLHRLMMSGRLRGSGRMIVLTADEGLGFGTGGAAARNPAAWDPHHAFRLSIDAGISAYAAPLGLIEAGAGAFAGQASTILMAQAGDPLAEDGGRRDLAVVATVDDALRLGCAAIGFEIQPGADGALDGFEEIAQLREEAASKGLATLIRCRPQAEGAAAASVDDLARTVRIAAVLGAHVIEARLPDGAGVGAPSRDDAGRGLLETLTRCRWAAFDGRRLLLASVDAAAGGRGLDRTARVVHEVGGGLVVGRDLLQGPRDAALSMTARLADALRGRDR